MKETIPTIDAFRTVVYKQGVDQWIVINGCRVMTIKPKSSRP